MTNNSINNSTNHLKENDPNEMSYFAVSQATSPCRSLAYLGFSGSLLHVFQYQMRYLVVSKKKIHYSCEGGIEKSAPRDHRLPSLGKARDDNR